MRSSGFVVLSILVHVLCFTALALTPVRTVSPDAVGESIEVKMGTPAEQPGVAEAPPAQEVKPQAIEEPKEQPKPEPVSEVKPEIKEAKKEAPVKKKAVVAKVAIAPKASKPVAKAAPVEAAAVMDENDDAPAVKTEEAAPPAQEAAKEEEPSQDILVPVKETAPVGVEAATNEDKEADAKAEEGAKPAQTASPAAPVGVAEQDKPTGDLAKGGASIEGAVSYLDLRQMKGNKAPVYPTQARLENRQGQLELVYRVTKEGRVADIQVAKSSGFKDLDNEAVKAIAQFKFVPGQEGWARHPVNFSLKGNVVTLPSRLRGKGAQAD